MSDDPEDERDADTDMSAAAVADPVVLVDEDGFRVPGPPRHLSTPLKETVRITADSAEVTIPPEDPLADRATSARVVWEYARRRVEEGLREARDGVDGYLWQGSLGQVMQLLWPECNIGTLRTVVYGYFARSANMVNVDKGNRKDLPTWWLRAVWDPTLPADGQRRVQSVPRGVNSEETHPAQAAVVISHAPDTIPSPDHTGADLFIWQTLYAHALKHPCPYDYPRTGGGSIPGYLVYASLQRLVEQAWPDVTQMSREGGRKRLSVRLSREDNVHSVKSRKLRDADGNQVNWWVSAQWTDTRRGSQPTLDGEDLTAVLSPPVSPEGEDTPLTPDVAETVSPEVQPVVSREESPVTEETSPDTGEKDAGPELSAEEARTPVREETPQETLAGPDAPGPSVSSVSVPVTAPATPGREERESEQQETPPCERSEQEMPVTQTETTTVTVPVTQAEREFRDALVAHDVTGMTEIVNAMARRAQEELAGDARPVTLSGPPASSARTSADPAYPRVIIDDLLAQIAELERDRDALRTDVAGRAGEREARLRELSAARERVTELERENVVLREECELLRSRNERAAVHLRYVLAHL